MQSHARPPTTTRDREVADAFASAEAAIRRRSSAGLTFSTVTAALGWYFEARAKMQAPNGMHPQTDVVNLRTGERARIDVDGGKGGDLDDVLATLATIRETLNRAHVEHPRGTAALVELSSTRTTQQAIADRHKVTQQAISKDVGRARDFVRRELEAAGVVR